MIKQLVIIIEFAFGMISRIIQSSASVENIDIRVDVMLGFNNY